MEEVKRLINEIIGSNIRKIRKNKGFSQLELAEKLNMARTSITNMEKGNHLPSIHTIYEIAEVFDIEIIEIIPSKAELKNQLKESKIDIKKVLKNIELTDDSKQSVSDIINNLI